MRERAWAGLAFAGVACAAAVAFAGARAKAPPPPCPAAFAKAVGTCDEKVSPPGRACVYPQGKCTCARTTPCSGVPQPPGAPAWRCEAARKDGCPNDAPPQGGACAKPGRTCSYGSCGSLAYTCSADKRWFISGGVAPPPAIAKAGPPPPPSAPSWKTCEAGSRFGCQPRSQGVAPARGEEVPSVCGCVPSCPPIQFVLAFEAEGTWPDGSRKGRFICSSAGIPSAAPPPGGPAL